MSTLPASLQRWAEPLSVLDPALAPALGAMLLRLAAALGPLGSTTQDGTQEPDGHAGLTQRGPLERLLTTEWALLSEAPEEFFRRLSTGELSYLEPAYRGDAQERHCLLLFDVGPEQLGAPRLAQLAAWVVFSQRAAAQGATLHWATLDAPPAPESLRQGFDAAGVRAFLDARTSVQADAKQLYAWRKWAAQALGTHEELWVLGGQRWWALPMARGVRLFCTEETEALEALQTLQVRLRPAGKTLQLALPPTRTQIRLLREPFPLAKARRGGKRTSHRPLTGPLVWLPGSRGVCAQAESEPGVLCFPIPSRPEPPSSSPRLYQPQWGLPNARFLAVGGYRSCLFGIVLGDSQLHVQRLKGSRSGLLTGTATLSEESLRLLNSATLGLSSCVLQQGTIRVHTGQARSLVLRREAEGLAATWSSAKAAYLLGLQTTLSVHFSARETSLRQLDSTELWTKIGELGEDCREALLFAGPRPKESVVVQQHDGRWYLPLASKRVPFPELDPTDTVLGATYYGGQVYLLSLSEAGRLVRVTGLASQRTLTGIGGKLLAAASSPEHPLLACHCESGELVIWDVANNTRHCAFSAPHNLPAGAYA